MFFLKGEKGFVNFYLLLVLLAIVLAVMLVGGFGARSNNNKLSNAKKGNLAENNTQNPQHGLQLGTLPFVTQAPPPSTNDCNNGIISGSPEASILYAISPDPGSSVGPGQAFKVFYNDEWPLTLGSGNVSPDTASPDHVNKPNIGDANARDSNNFPYFPALFLSDITTNANNKSGDAEQGGSPHPPDDVYGTWKGFGGTYAFTSRCQTINGLPPPNNNNLGSGADPWPAQSNINFTGKLPPIGNPYGDQCYSAEIAWQANNLGLQSGHTYRAEFIIHDGDRAGDFAEGCTTIRF